MAPNGYMDEVKPTDYSPIEKEQSANGEVKIAEPQQLSKRQPLKFINIILLTVIHISGVAAAIYVHIEGYYFSTFLFQLLVGVSAGFGVTGGAHRFWTHRAYKAKLPLRIILAICYSIAGQNTIPDWVRDHRVHHRFSETDADPHNSNRGFFFAHVGWLMQKKHPEVIRRGREIDMSDIYSDVVVKYHTKFFFLWQVLFAFVLPTVIPYYCFGERFEICLAAIFIRYMISLNSTWSVNSAAHMFGNRPFSTRIRPVENVFVAFFAMGEGWHNYHHVFPWDYKAAEIGHFILNPTAILIDLFAKIGWAYDLKSPSKDLVERIAKRFGDGSERIIGHCHPPEIDEHGQEVCTEHDDMKVTEASHVKCR